MFHQMGKAIDVMLNTMLVLSFLGVWKLIEIVYWLLTNVTIGLK